MTDPYAVVGGDVAYENAMRSCYRCWDLWLEDWEERMVTPQGYSVPMVVNVGNHDAGTNTLDNAFGSLCKARWPWRRGRVWWCGMVGWLYVMGAAWGGMRLCVRGVSDGLCGCHCR